MDYLSQLPNLDRRNPKILVVFSGGNAVGKSTISNKIAAKFEGLVLENDAVKRTLLKRDPNLERPALNELTWQYTTDLYKRLDTLTPNGLIVRDGIIDWYFERILPVFEQAGYALFIIAFDLSRKKSIELIHARGDTPTVKETRLYELLDQHADHTRRFRTAYTPDITLTDDTVFDHDAVLAALGEKLARLAKKD
jgi:predicted kinase